MWKSNRNAKEVIYSKNMKKTSYTTFKKTRTAVNMLAIKPRDNQSER